MNRAALEKMLADGKDSALLRFSLGGLLANEGDHAGAVEHFQRAVVLDGRYSAAWRALGKSLTELGRNAEAITTYRSGIEAAQAGGDVQAAREMGVFLKRLQR